MQAEMLDSTICNSLQLFADKGFRVRVVMREGEPWFVAKDVCECLDLANSRDAVSRLDDDEKGVGKADTLGGYGIRTVDDMINDPDTAIRLLTQLKILRLQNDQLAMERDEAIRTRAMIGSRREATAMAMATASAKSRECAKLTTENAELKDAVGRGTNWRTVAMMRAEWIRDFGHAPDWHKLKKFSADFPKEMKPVRDVEVKVALSNGSERVNLLTRYHQEAWAKYREYEENLRVSARSCRDTKILDLRAADTEIEYF